MSRANFLPLLVSLGLIAGCGTQIDPSSDELRVEPVEIRPDLFEYVRVPELEAELVLIVELVTPALPEPDVHRIPLKCNPNARWHGMAWESFGWCTVGTRSQYGGSISVSGGGSGEEPLSVSVSIRWWRDHIRGESSAKVSLPWLGKVEQNLGSDCFLSVYFIAPE